MNNCVKPCTCREKAPAHNISCIHQDYCRSKKILGSAWLEEEQEDMAKEKATHCRICGCELTDNNHYLNEAVCKTCRTRQAAEHRKAKKAGTPAPALPSIDIKDVQKKGSEYEMAIIGTITKDMAQAVIDSLTDLQLKEELQRRGWEVKCTKTIIAEL